MSMAYRLEKCEKNRMAVIGHHSMVAQNVLVYS